MTDVHCKDCGHVRETTEQYSTLVVCEMCGSPNVEYTNMTNDIPEYIESLNEYQRATEQTNKPVEEFPDFITPDMVKFAMGVSDEAGEVQGKVKKAIREDDPSYLEDAVTECGDTLWYLARFLDELDVDLSEVATENMDKLMDRDERGQITGEGDDR